VHGITPSPTAPRIGYSTSSATYTLQQPDWATRIFGQLRFHHEAVTAGKNQSVQFYVASTIRPSRPPFSRPFDDRFANSPDQRHRQ